MAPIAYADLNGCTVYVQRIVPERLNSQNQIDALAENIRVCFEEYGTILDVIVKRSNKRKGQAFVVFDSPESAEKAQEDLDGFDFFPDSPIITSIAKTPSDAVVQKFCSPEEFEEHKERRLAEKSTFLRLLQRQKWLLTTPTARKQADEEEARARAEEESKKRSAAEPTSGIRPMKTLKSTSKQTVIPSEYLPPNKLIMVENVPADMDKDTLMPLFAQFEGLQDIRKVTVGRYAGLVFVEFAAIAGATAAKEALGNTTLGDKVLKITYSKEA